jgi:RNA repair, ligase-Pnkp-associating, region of Hen1
MLLTITTTHVPATDMGFLLEKHPDKVQEFELSSGRATVFYPEATPERWVRSSRLCNRPKPKWFDTLMPTGVTVGRRTDSRD